MNIPWKLPTMITVIIAAAVTLTGCAATTSADLSKACAKVATVNGALTCSELYSTGKALRLPTHEGTILGAVARDGSSFISSNGAHLRLSAAAPQRRSRR